MKKNRSIKSLTVFALMCIFAVSIISVAAADPHYLVIDDESPSTDVIILSGISTKLVVEKQKAESFLRSEVDEIPDDAMTITVYYGDVTITYPEGYEALAKKTSDYVDTNYDIEAEIVKLDESRPSREVLNKGITLKKFESLDISSPLIIRGESDDSASSMVEKKYSSAEQRRSGNVTASSMINSDIYIIGGPCANSNWADFSQRTCADWDLSEGQGIVKILNNGAKKVILIAGTTQADTEQLTEMFFSGELDAQLEEESEIIVNLN